MKNKIKNIMVNCIIVFIIIFTIFFIFQAHSQYEYYSTYTKEDLNEFFSMKSHLHWIFIQSLKMSCSMVIFYLPILVILEITKIKNIFKIIITICLSFIIAIIYAFANLKIVF